MVRYDKVKYDEYSVVTIVWAGYRFWSVDGPGHGWVIRESGAQTDTDMVQYCKCVN